MARRLGKATDADYLKLFESYCDNFKRATPVNTRESQAERTKRKLHLEAHPEEWFKYYFPNYCTAEPNTFHKAATRRILRNKEWFEVRAWSRELAKSARSMMEICFLAMTGDIHNVLLVSNSHDNATNLLAPFKALFEANQRIEQDYGRQHNIGSWQADKFTLRCGCSFRALGWGESPRGTRNEAKRPDFILMDDFDTDEECRNEDTMKKKIAWLEQALIPTRSISEPTRILVNGNIIHDNCAVKYMGENLADKFDIVNIRNKDGKSSWPEKNTEEQIDRVLATISYESAQKEYFNNPMDGGDVFKDLVTGKVPPLRRCTCLVYADPSSSNRDVSSGSLKAVGLIAAVGLDFYIVKAKLDTMTSAHFVDALFDIYDYAVQHGAENLQVWVENNTLQDPIYQQVYMPLIHERSMARGTMLPIMPDSRSKGDKYTRIEGTLEPIHRAGHLTFNEAESENPDMKRLMAQFRNFSRKQKRMDGPDMVEGGIFKLKEKLSVMASEGFFSVKRTNKHKL